MGDTRAASGLPPVEAGTVAPGIRARRFVGAPAVPPPSPLSRPALTAWTQQKLKDYVDARASGESLIHRSVLLSKWLTAWSAQLFPLRVWNLYTRRRGPLLAAGSAYLMFFSVGAMLVAGFAVIGLVAVDHPELRNAIITLVADSTPGLIDTGHGGLATPEQLLGTSGFGLTLVISLIALTVTSLGWIAGLREGIRTVLGITRDRTNPIISKLRDAGILLVLAVALVATSVLGLASSTVLDTLTGFLGWGSLFSGLATRVASVALMLILDVAVAVVLFRLASRVRMPKRAILWASLTAGAGATILRFFSAMLLGGVTNNALLAPFAVILGLFVWFYLLSQVYLISAALGAVRSADLRAPNPNRVAPSPR